MEDFSVYQPGQQLQQPDTYLYKFYERLSELFAHWIPLEDVHYRTLSLGELDFGKVPEMTKWPDLGFFNTTIARNGGPVAFMIQDNVLFIGIKEIKSMIFVFSYYGKRLNVINVREIGFNDFLQMSAKLSIPKDKLKWSCFEFTPEEDLLLVSQDGMMYLIDPLTGDFKEKPVNLGVEFATRPI